MPYANKEQCDNLLSQLPPECCLKCRFFEKHEEATSDKYYTDSEPHYFVTVRGDCRRLPPVPIPSENNVVVSLFPDVRDRDWCGEFEMAKEDRGMKYVCWE
jgi:hypothetical protein